MRAIRLLVLIGLASASVVLLAAPQGVTLVVHRNANLRASATTQSAIKDKLLPGDEVTKISPAKQNGFHHVRTSAGIDGWIYQTLVHQEEEDTVPTTPPIPGVSTAFDPNWPKPNLVGSILQGPSGKDPCPANGELGGDVETNRRKNRKDVPSSYRAVTWDALADLPYPNAPPKRKDWSAAQLAEIAPFEGVAVSVVGFIVAVKKQTGGEGTNCDYTLVNFNDIHMALVEHPGDGEEKAIVVEPTPRFYAAHPTWVWAKLNELDDSPDPVRISGWTLLDPNHRPHLGVFRQTLWEIHPITKIEVFKNGQWSVR